MSMSFFFCIFIKYTYTKVTTPSFTGRGFDSQPEAFELHFSQLVPVESYNVYLSDTELMYILSACDVIVLTTNPRVAARETLAAAKAK